MKQVLVKTGIVLILSCNAVQVQAAPADMLSQQSRIDQIEQQQSAKRQAREERERINAPNVNLAPQTETAEAVQLPKEKVSFLIRKIEKCSLQGTTQSRYLTGGGPPVRFSM